MGVVYEYTIFRTNKNDRKSEKIENHTIDPEKTLYLACDASQVACGYILFQIGDDGNIIMCSTSTRVFIRASRNKSAAFRELLAIVTGVTDQEYVIRNHTSDVVILSDSISLSMITRKKFTQNKLLEIAIFPIFRRRAQQAI